MKITTKQLTTVFTLITVVCFVIACTTNDPIIRAIAYLLSLIFLGAIVCGIIELIENNINK